MRLASGSGGFYEIDAIDKKIAAALAFDCRAPLKRVASRTRLSWEVVDYRMKKMEESGFIQNYYAVIDYDKLGSFMYRGYLKFAGMPEREYEKLFDALSKNLSVEWFCLCGGYWDLVFRAGAKNNAQFVEKMRFFYDEFGEYVSRQHIGLSVGFRIYPPTVLLPVDASKREAFFEPVFQERVETDETDLKILSSLSENARKSFLEIGKESGVEPGVARYRMKKLAEEGVLAGFITTFDYSVLGLERYKIFFSTKPSERKKIASYFCELPNTYVVLTMLGAWDLEVEVIAQNGFELQKLIRETLRKFPNAIRNYETTSLFKDRFNKHDFAYLKQR